MPLNDLDNLNNKMKSSLKMGDILNDDSARVFNKSRDTIEQFKCQRFKMC